MDEEYKNGSCGEKPSWEYRIAALERALAEERAELAQERESHRQNLGQCNEHVKELQKALRSIRDSEEQDLGLYANFCQETAEQVLKKVKQ